MFIAFLDLYWFLPHDFVKIDPHSHKHKIREHATHVDFTVMQCAATSFYYCELLLLKDPFKQAAFDVISKEIF